MNKTSLNPISGSKVKAILLKGLTFLLVELHLEGTVPAACAAGLFLVTFRVFFLIFKQAIRLHKKINFKKAIMALAKTVELLL